MNPAVIGLVLTVVLGVLLKYLEYKVATQHRVLDYDKRWSDPEYVKMIHATREKEAALGIDLTECECKAHTVPPKPKYECRECGKPVNSNNGAICGDCYRAKLPGAPSWSKDKPTIEMTGAYRVDGAGPGFLQFKVSRQYYDKLPRAAFMKPKKFMGLDIIDVNFDKYGGDIVYLRCRPPGAKSSIILTNNSIITAPKIGNERTYK